MKKLLQVAAVSLLVMSAGSVSAQSNPCNPCGGKASMVSASEVMTSAPNPCDAKMGTVFYVSDPMGRNSVSFTSEAPLEDIVGTSNEISGYIVFDPANPGRGAHGELVVAVSSLRTGIPLRDEHLQGSDWLDASQHNTISFQISDLNSVRVVKQAAGFKTFEVVAEGSFSLHGVTRDITVPVRMTYLEESESTKSKMPGNLLAARASFDVSLNDFGIKGMKGVVGSKVGESIKVDVSFMGTTMAMNAGHVANPSNPCGGKSSAAANPCNPCGR